MGPGDADADAEAEAAAAAAGGEAGEAGGPPLAPAAPAEETPHCGATALFLAASIRSGLSTSASMMALALWRAGVLEAGEAAEGLGQPALEMAGAGLGAPLHQVLCDSQGLGHEEEEEEEERRRREGGQRPQY